MEKPAWKKEHRPTFHRDLTVSWKKSDLLKRQMKF